MSAPNRYTRDTLYSHCNPGTSRRRAVPREHWPDDNIAVGIERLVWTTPKAAVKELSTKILLEDCGVAVD